MGRPALGRCVTQPRYLLDAGILIGLQKIGHLDALASIATKVTLVIVEEVYDELTEPRGGKHRTEAGLAKVALDLHTTQVSIDPMGAAGRRLDALRARKRKATAADLGEDASVAWAFDQKDCVLVTRDFAGAFLALDELRGRAMTFFHFIYDVVDAGALPIAKAREIGAATPVTPGVTLTPPLWWKEWLADREA